MGDRVRERNRNIKRAQKRNNPQKERVAKNR